MLFDPVQPTRMRQSANCARLGEMVRGQRALCVNLRTIQSLPGVTHIPEVGPAKTGFDRLSPRNSRFYNSLKGVL
jgi:hypothetical protein